jgi:hypothetical protein
MKWSERAEKIWKWYLDVSQTRLFFVLELAAVLCLSFTYFYIYQFASTHLCGTDPYYHIKFAYLTRTEGIITDFHWAQFSLWKEHFFDKEFLYHLYLALFTYGDLITGAKWATLVMGCAIFTSFFTVLKINGVRYRWLWWILLCSSGGYLLFRINVTRPQTLSVLLLIIGLHFLINERYWIVGLLSFIYSLSYTGHYQYVGLTFIYMLVIGLKDRRWPWRNFAWAGGGMLLGWLVHPNFPHNIRGFFVQNVMVIFHQLHQQVDLHMGGELGSMTTRSMLNVCSSTIIPLWLVFTIALAKRYKADARTMFLFAASTVYLVLAMITKRFGEYWIPVSALFVAFYFSGLPRQMTLGYWWQKHRWAFWTAAAVLAVGLPVMFVRSHWDTYRQLNRCGESHYAPSARWVAEHVPAGETVLTCDWDDAPYLFFYAHEQNYTVFLDPTFMYFWKPSLWKRWDKLTHAKDRRPLQTLLHYFGVRYVYCTGDFKAFKKQLRRTPGAELVYPRPPRGARGRPCRIDTDCAAGTICKNPACKPGKPCRLRSGRCVVDPHVYVYHIRPALGGPHPRDALRRQTPRRKPRSPEKNR